MERSYHSCTRQQKRLQHLEAFSNSTAAYDSLVMLFTLHNVIIIIIIIIRPHCTNSYMQPIATDGVAWSICVSACWSHS